jgi:hypothetical protein
MQSQFYIAADGNKDGPHDLVTIMRRIRAGKVEMNTLIYVDDATTALPANQVDDLKAFFSHKGSTTTKEKSKVGLFTLLSVVREGVRFTLENNIMTVFAGGIALIGMLLSASLMNILGESFGGLLSWIIFVMFHYMYSVFCLRLYRGQPISADFMNNHLAPILSTVLIAAMFFALMVAGGFILLVIPALVVAISYIFVPFFIMDRKMGVMTAMTASRLLVSKANQRSQNVIILLILAYLGSMILIIPLPLTMPIFTAAIIKIYEEISAS